MLHYLYLGVRGPRHLSVYLTRRRRIWDEIVRDSSILVHTPAVRRDASHLFIIFMIQGLTEDRSLMFFKLGMIKIEMSLVIFIGGSSYSMLYFSLSLSIYIYQSLFLHLRMLKTVIRWL
jgi:hypothetical protein